MAARQVVHPKCDADAAQGCLGFLSRLKSACSGTGTKCVHRQHFCFSDSLHVAQMHVQPMRYRFHSLKGRLQLPGLNRRLIGVPQMVFREGGGLGAGDAGADGAAAAVPRAAGKLVGHRASICVDGSGQG